MTWRCRDCGEKLKTVYPFGRKSKGKVTHVRGDAVCVARKKEIQRQSREFFQRLKQ